MPTGVPTRHGAAGLLLGGCGVKPGVLGLLLGAACVPGTQAWRREHSVQLKLVKRVSSRFRKHESLYCQGSIPVWSWENNKSDCDVTING